MKSDEWKIKRDIILHRDPICRICDKSKSTDPHHLTYDNIPFEAPEDLIGVCRKCHNRIHKHRMLSERKSLLSLKWVFHASKNNKDLLIKKDLGRMERYLYWKYKIAGKNPLKSKRRFFKSGEVSFNDWISSDNFV